MEAEKTRLQKGVVGPSDKTSATGFAGLLSDVHRSTYRTLGWTAGVVGGLSLFYLVRWLLGAYIPGTVWADLLVIVASGIVFWISRSGKLSPSLFAKVALSFEIFVGQGINR